MKRVALFCIGLILSCVLFIALMTTGAVDIPFYIVLKALFTSSEVPDNYYIIIMQARLPMALAALFSGAALSVAGLLLQTTFQNPLAGPSILGVSSGASLGVAVVTLAAGSFISWSSGLFTGITGIVGALLGAGLVILLLISLSSSLRSNTMLLIAGMMLSYLASSLITLLNYFAPATDVKQFAVWGMGSFSALRLNDLWLFAGSLFVLLAVSFLLIKPLNALLLGERYAASMGFNIKRLRNSMLIISGALTAIVTAFCGPIGFLGLVIPHIARIVFRTSDHSVLLPATVVCGMLVGLLCAWISVIPTGFGLLPINAITPIIGVPIILYILLRRDKLRYFN